MERVALLEIYLTKEQQKQVKRMISNVPGRGSYRSVCQSIIDEVLRDDAIEHGEVVK